MRELWRSLRAFLGSRWRGHVPLKRIFVRDMLIIGTVINLAVALAAILMASADAPTPLVVAVFCSVLPYNFLLYVGVWTAASQATSIRATVIRLVATIWVLASIVV